MPRKSVSDPAAQPAEPRRSTRISAIPKEIVAAAAAAVKAPKRASKKRTADEADVPGEEGTGTGTGDAAENADAGTADASNKKAKGDGVADDNDGQNSQVDELEADSDNDVAVLDIGSVLPAITLKNEKDEDVNVQGLASENGLVLFLVPKANTPGCNDQACGFRDIYPDFEAVNYKVYCVSADPVAAQSKWQTKFTLPYPLLSDPKRTLIKALGASISDGKKAAKTKRSHFIFEQGGKLVEKKVPVKPADSPKLALQFIKNLNPTAVPTDTDTAMAIDTNTDPTATTTTEPLA